MQSAVNCWRSARSFVLGSLLIIVSAAPSHATLLLHSTMDNVDVGSGLGTDTTSDGAFDVRDTIGTLENGSAKDISGGAATSAAHITSGATGKIGQAISFPSSTADDRGVTYGNVHNIGTGNYTVSLWLNTTDLTSGPKYIATKGNRTSSLEGWAIFTESGNLRARMGLGGAGLLDRASMSDTITSGAWHHVALSINNTLGVVTGYLDGNVMATNGGGGPTNNLFTASSNISTADPIVLGINNANTGEFNGLIDDFGIFNTALSASDIQKIHSNGLAGFNLQQQQTVPEPSTAVLLLTGVLGGFGIAWRRRRRRS